MSNPAKAPTVPFVLSQDMPPDPYWPFLESPEWEEVQKTAKQLPEVVALLDGLDVEYRNSFFIPKEHSVADEVLNTKKQYMARAKKGRLQARVSSKAAYDVLVPIWQAIPLEDRQPIASAIQGSAYCDGGAEYALGRLAAHAPRKGASGHIIPPTDEEARLSLIRNGVDLPSLPSHLYTAYPLEPLEANGKKVESNPKASTGFPVLGKGGDAKAAAKVSVLAATVRKEIVDALNRPGGVRAWLRKAEDERPWLVSLQGKAKADNYTEAKVKGKMLRFYNTVPKQTLLNMQLAMQPLEACKTNCLIDSEVHSTAGMSLAHGGAELLIMRAERDIAKQGYAYFTCGDDTFFAYKDSEECIHLFALDCTAFDITQHGDASKPIHDRIRDQLALIDRAAADLWHAYMRKRQVVVALTCTIRTSHWGASGMPGQSLVNGCYMDVACQRLVGGLQRKDAAGPLHEENINRAISVVGRTLNMKVRVEQYRMGDPDQSLKSMLADKPFLFIGYNFYTTSSGRVRAYCDLPRQLAQMRYPMQKWMQKGQQFQTLEAVRLGSIMINWGVFPRPLMKLQLIAADAANDKLEECIKKHGDQESEDFRWAVAESPFGLATIPSLTGVQRVLLADPEDFWDAPEIDPTPEPEPRVRSQALAGGGLWSDLVDADEEAERRALGIKPVPRGKPLPLPISLPSQPVPTHPATAANLGRPPPTAVWGPDKPKRERRDWGSGPSRIGRVARVLLEEEEEHWQRYVVEQGYEEEDRPAQAAPFWEEATLEEYEDWRNEKAYHGTETGLPDLADDGDDDLY